MGLAPTKPRATAEGLVSLPSATTKTWSARRESHPSSRGYQPRILLLNYAPLEVPVRLLTGVRYPCFRWESNPPREHRECWSGQRVLPPRSPRWQRGVFLARLWPHEVWLGRLESNQDSRGQNPACYHYTTPQWWSRAESNRLARRAPVLQTGGDPTLRATPKDLVDPAGSAPAASCLQGRRSPE